MIQGERGVLQIGSRILLVAMAGGVMAACDVADGADIQPLPPLDRPSPEVRAGLPEVAGEWRFAGWDVPAADPATAVGDLAPAGDLVISVQRLDSIAGVYAAGVARSPLVGEVRRDGTVALVVEGGEGEGSFLAGRVGQDTLWVELTSLPVAETWPEGTRAAFRRDSVRVPFVRVAGVLLQTEPDTLAAPPADSALRETPSTPAPAPVSSALPDTVEAQPTEPRDPAQEDTRLRPTPPDTLPLQLPPPEIVP